MYLKEPQESKLLKLIILETGCLCFFKKLIFQKRWLKLDVKSLTSETLSLDKVLEVLVKY